MNTQLTKATTSLKLDVNYNTFLSEIKNRLKTAQIRAALASNQALIHFYWQLGKELVEKQNSFKWGEKLLEQFSHDMRQEFPEMQGFSITNLKRMRLFTEAYPDFEIGPQLVDQLPWGHIALLIHKIKSPEIRQWYTQQTIEYGWSRAVLAMQIETGLYERQEVSEKKTTNYHLHLPAPQSDLANQILKDPYNFDFLTIQDKARERSIENALINHIKDFLLELGQGFAFVGSQVPLTFGDQEFFIDLLFYHIKLHSFVVIELKTAAFKPEHTGQLGFYLAAVDDQMRQPGDNQSIGILLRQSKNKVVAEYALRSSKMPIGISEYELSNTLPKDLQTSLPTIEEIEAKLNAKMD